MDSRMMRIVLINSNDRVLKNFTEKASANAQDTTWRSLVLKFDWASVLWVAIRMTFS